jgi:histidinol-phosphate aminotransferase
MLWFCRGRRNHESTRTAGTMAKEKDVVEKAALSDGGHVISGAQSIHEAPGPDKLRFDLNENLFGPSPKVKEAIKSFVDQIGVNWYNAWMRKQCPETVAQYAAVKPENVFVCNGSAEILVLIAEMFLQPGDEILTEYPTYRVLLNYAKIYNSRIVKVHQAEDFSTGHFPREFIEKIRPKTKIIYICNPTTFSSRVSYDGIVEILEASQRSPNPIVVIDEAYYDSATHPFSNVTVAGLIEKYDNLIVTRSCSKGFALAGLRIGYSLSCRRLTESFNKFFSPLGVSSLGYVGLMAAIDDPGYYDKVREELEASKAYLSDELVKLDVTVFPSYANFMLARLPAGILNDGNGRKGVWSLLVDEGIYVRNKSVMYPDTDLCRDMIRITPGTRQECERFIGALKRIMKAFR